MLRIGTSCAHQPKLVELEAEQMLEFTRNGRKVSSKQFFDGMLEDAVAQAENEIEGRLKALRDPETGKPVKVTKQRRNGEATWNVEGSPQAIAAAKKIVGAG